MRLLDIGCGTGRFLDFVKQAWPRLPACGLDMSEAYVRHAKRRLARRSRISSCRQGGSHPAPDNSQDAVTSIFLFHELPPKVRRAALGECARVLKPGGRLVLVDSLQRGDRPDYEGLLELFPQNYHEPYYLSYINEDFARSRALRADARARRAGIRLQGDGVRQAVSEPGENYSRTRCPFGHRGRVKPRARRRWPRGALSKHHDPKLARLDDCFRAAVGLELVEDGGDVKLDGVEGDVQPRAISLLDAPSAIAASTSISRAVNRGFPSASRFDVRRQWRSCRAAPQGATAEARRGRRPAPVSPRQFPSARRIAAKPPMHRRQGLPDSSARPPPSEARSRQAPVPRLQLGQLPARRDFPRQHNIDVMPFRQCEQCSGTVGDTYEVIAGSLRASCSRRRRNV